MERTAGLIVDTNLLVLYVVGSVNPERIETFKRTRLAHVLAEVSNLTI